MSRIDYSKWDNIDTDTESDEDQVEDKPQNTLQPAAAAPAQPAPNTQHAVSEVASEPAPTAQAGDQPSIQCVHVPAGGNWQWFKAHPVPANHKVFTEGAASPVGMLVGFPLRVWRQDPRPSLSIPRTAVMDNQKITYCMIDPFSGFAPPQWQQGIGDVICGRRDRKPLLPAHFEAFWMFVNNLLGIFSSGVGVDPAVEMTPAKFRAFWEEYKCSMEEAPSRREEWADVRAPWEL